MSGLNFSSILWDQDDDPAGNVLHIARHHLGKEDIEHVFDHPTGTGLSRSSGRPVVFGETPDGRYIMIAFEVIDAATVYPVTAFEVPRPKRKRT